tara:strand:- start:706 stop:1065 length:360 start_codon:yes stop_codon:yes gene_type:complete
MGDLDHLSNYFNNLNVVPTIPLWVKEDFEKLGEEIGTHFLDTNESTDFEIMERLKLNCCYRPETDLDGLTSERPYIELSFGILCKEVMKYNSIKNIEEWIKISNYFELYLQTLGFHPLW